MQKTCLIKIYSYSLFLPASLLPFMPLHMLPKPAAPTDPGVATSPPVAAAAAAAASPAAGDAPWPMPARWDAAAAPGVVWYQGQGCPPFKMRSLSYTSSAPGTESCPGCWTCCCSFWAARFRSTRLIEDTCKGEEEKKWWINYRKGCVFSWQRASVEILCKHSGWDEMKVLLIIECCYHSFYVC